MALSSPTRLVIPTTPLTRRPKDASPSAASSSPLRSSPLNPNYRLNNPPSQRRASANNQFHVQSRYIRPGPSFPLPGDGSGSPSNERDPQKALWRERFRQKCAERIERDRTKFRDAARSRSSNGGSEATSSRHAMSDDMEMDDNEGEDFDDPVSILCLTLHSTLFERVSPYSLQ